MFSSPVRARHRGAVTLALATALLCAACGTATTATTTGTSSTQPLKVVAAFYPLQFAAESVGGPSVEVTNLTAPGAEPHDLELTPQQVVAIREADVVLYLPGFQPAVDEAIAAEASTKALDLSHGQALRPATESEIAEATEEGLPVPANDPHIWLNPLTMASIGSTIKTKFAELRGEKTAGFTQRADALTQQLTELDARWSEATQTCTSRDLVVSHEAFGYLADRYNFTQRGISGLSPEAEPSPAKVAEVTDFVRANGVNTIYYETLVDPKVAEVISAETGVSTAVLDPLEGVAEGSPDTYLTLMQRNLDTVIAGQGCR